MQPRRLAERRGLLQRYAAACDTITREFDLGVWNEFFLVRDGMWIDYSLVKEARPSQLRRERDMQFAVHSPAQSSIHH